jgi:hypothetical protein
MLATLSSRFHTWAKGWLILASLAALVGFVALTIPVAQAASGDTEGLDTRHYYTPEEAFATIASYSAAGRAALRVFYLTGDIVNPVLYTSFLVLLISWLFQRGFDPRSRLQILNVVPVGAAVFDLLENVCIVIMLSVYPAQPRIVAWLATTGTTLKYLFIYTSFVLVLVGLIKAGFRAARLVAGKQLSKESLE